jgi:hypothetical protein
MKRRTTLAFAATAMLAACASMNQFTADVTTFGEWPAARAGATFSFERMPSQQGRPEAQQRLEDAARPTLVRAGLRPAAEGTEPDLVVQIGARLTRLERSPWDDPLWWHGGFGRWHRGPWRGPYWGMGWRMEPARYEQEVALLIRERASGRPLYETRASTDGPGQGGDHWLAPLFAAALAEFPAVKPQVHAVTVPLPSR